MSGWGTNVNANRIKDSYIKGFLDISGGPLKVEKTSSLQIISHDSDNPVIEFKSEYFTVNTTSSIDVSYSSLATLGLLGVSFEQSTAGLIQRVKYITTGTTGVPPNEVFYTQIGNDDEKSQLQVYGFIKGHYGLEIDGNVSFNNNFLVVGDSSFNNDVLIGGNLYVTKRSVFSLDVSMNQNLDIGSGTNSVAINKDISAGYALDVSGLTILRNRLFVGSDASFGTNLFVVGDTSLNGNVRLGTNNQSVFINKDISSGYALDVSGLTILRNRLFVGSDASFGTRLFVLGDTSLNGNVRLGTNNQSVFINKDISAGYALDVSGLTILRSGLQVGSDASFGTRLFVVGDTSLNGNLYVNQDLLLNGNLYVSKRSVFTLDVSMNGNVRLGTGVQSVFINKDISAGYALDVSGLTILRNRLFVGSDASFGTNLFVVGDTSLNGNLYVTKRSVFTGDVSMNGNLSISGTLINYYNMSAIDTSINTNYYNRSMIDSSINTNYYNRSAIDSSINTNYYNRSAIDSSINTNYYNRSAIDSSINTNYYRKTAIDSSINTNYYNRSMIDSSINTNYYNRSAIDSSINTNYYNRSMIDSSINTNYYNRSVMDTSFTGIASTSGNVNITPVTAFNVTTPVTNINGNLDIGTGSSLVSINKDISAGYALDVSGLTILRNRLFVGSDASFGTNLFVVGDTSLNGNLYVTRRSVFTGDVSMNGNLSISGTLINYYNMSAIDTSINTNYYNRSMIDSSINTNYYNRSMIDTSINTNYYNRSMIDTSINTNYYNRSMIDTSINTNYYNRSMIDTSINTNYYNRSAIDSSINTNYYNRSAIDSSINTNYYRKTAIDSSINTNYYNRSAIDSSINTNYYNRSAIDSSINTNYYNRSMIDSSINTNYYNRSVMDTSFTGIASTSGNVNITPVTAFNVTTPVTNINGNLSVVNIINPNTAGDCNLWTNSTGGNINIGTQTATGLFLKGSTIDIQSSSTVGFITSNTTATVNIGTGNFTTASGIMNIFTGTNGANAKLNIGTGGTNKGEINIGTGSTNSGNVNILTGASNTGKLVVGGDVSMNGNLSISGTLINYYNMSAIDSSINTNYYNRSMIDSSINTNYYNRSMIDSSINTNYYNRSMIDSSINTNYYNRSMIDSSINTNYYNRSMIDSSINTNYYNRSAIDSSINTNYYNRSAIDSSINTNYYNRSAIDSSINTNYYRKTAIDSSINTNYYNRSAIDSSINTNYYNRSAIDSSINTNYYNRSAIDSSINTNYYNRSMIDSSINTNYYNRSVMDTSFTGIASTSGNVNITPVTAFNVTTPVTNINGNLDIGTGSSLVSINKDISAGYALDVSGLTILRNRLFVDSDASFGTNLFVVGDTSLNGNLYVTKRSVFTGDVSMNGNLSISGTLINYYNMSAIDTSINTNYYNRSMIDSSINTNYYNRSAIDSSINTNYYNRSAIDSSINTNYYNRSAIDSSINTNYYRKTAIDSSINTNYYNRSMIDSSINTNYYNRSMIDSSINTNYYNQSMIDSSINTNYYNKSAIDSSINTNYYNKTAIDSSINTNYYNRSTIDSSINTNYYNKTAIDSSINTNYYNKSAIDATLSGIVSGGTTVVLAGNVQVGSSDGFVTIDKPYFYSDPSLTIYYDFDTASYNLVDFIVAVGEGGNTIATSSNGTTWAGKGTSVINTLGNRVAYGNGIFMAVGSSVAGNTIASSTDGITWTGRNTTGTGVGIAYGNGLWVALGNGLNTSSISTSSNNGNSWTAATNIFTNGYCAAYGKDGAGGNLWVAGGYSGGGNTTTILASSTNGTTWTKINTTVFSNNCRNIVYANGIWVALGATNEQCTIATSTNGTSWTARATTIFSAGYSAAYGKDNLGNGLWVAGGQGGTNTIAKSTDNGNTWTGVSSNNAIFTSCWDVTYTGSLWVAVGEGTNAFATSVDGTTWTGGGKSGLNTSGRGLVAIKVPGTTIANKGNGGAGYTATLQGASTGMIDTTNYKFGTASLKNIFATNNQGIKINTSVPTGKNMTFSFWLRKNNKPPSTEFDRIFEFSDNTGGSGVENRTIALDISSSGIILPVLTGNNSVSTASCFGTLSTPIGSYDVCDDTWKNIIWVINGSSSVLYVNGSNIQRDTIVGTNPFDISSARTTATIGHSTVTGVDSRDFSGNIDDFRYYKDKALSYAEIYQLYNNRFYTLDICGGFLANGSSVIYEPVGSKATANSGSLTLLHGDASGSSSIMFKSVNDPQEYGYIQYEENSTGSTGYHYGLMTIGIENDAGSGSYTAQADRISLFPSGGTGFVGVNTKTPVSALDVSGSIQAFSYNATSDYRAKDEVVPLNTSFTVDSLNPVTYKFKATGKQDVGFIAHEVQEFYPFLVNGEKDGPHNQSLNYNGFIGILTKEIKVLKKKVAEQEAKSAEQEAKSAEQEQRISALEKMVSDLVNK